MLSLFGDFARRVRQNNWLRRRLLSAHGANPQSEDRGHDGAHRKLPETAWHSDWQALTTIQAEMRFLCFLKWATILLMVYGVEYVVEELAGKET